MAGLRVRYRNGDTDEWFFHERSNVEDLYQQLSRTFASGGKVGFGAAARSEETTEYAMINLDLNEIVMMEFDGMLDLEYMNSWLGAPDQ